MYIQEWSGQRSGMPAATCVILLLLILSYCRAIIGQSVSFDHWADPPTPVEYPHRVTFCFTAREALPNPYAYMHTRRYSTVHISVYLSASRGFDHSIHNYEQTQFQILILVGEIWTSQKGFSSIGSSAIRCSITFFEFSSAIRMDNLCLPKGKNLVWRWMSKILTGSSYKDFKNN